MIKSLLNITIFTLFFTIGSLTKAELPPAMTLKLPSNQKPIPSSGEITDSSALDSVTISKEVSDELRTLDQKLKMINIDCKAKIQALKDALSSDAKAAISNRQQELTNKVIAQ